MNFSRFLFSLLWLLASGLSLLVSAGCAKRELPVDRATREQTLLRAIDVDPSDLDPHIVVGIAEGKIFSALFDRLVRTDGKTLRPIPALAASWEISPDGLVYTFHLRPNARWSNGEPLTAQDCIDSWRRALTPSLAADYAYQFYCIKGAEAFNKSTADFSTVGLAAPDAHTVRITLEQPLPYFIGLLDQSVWSPLNLRAIAAHGDPYRRGSAWTRPQNMVTSGPFTLKEWVPAQHILLEKSPTYWNAANVRLRAMDFFPIEGADTQERAFRAGQLHVTDQLPMSKVATYRSNQPQLLRTDAYFNVRHAPFDDPRVRRALSLALDRQALATKILLAGQTPATAFTPPGLSDYTPPTGPFTDLPAARRLLAEAGYTEARRLPPIDLLIPTKGNGPLVGEAVQEFWRRDLGLDVRVLKQDQKVIYAERRAGNYQILLSDWIGDYFDATTFLDMFLSDSGNNHTGWKSADYDALLAHAARTLNPAARSLLLQKAEVMLLDAAPIAPLYFNTHVYLIQPVVKGWAPTSLDSLEYDHVWLGK
jgi:oligopeptide transport system substrate-binding protein